MGRMIKRLMVVLLSVFMFMGTVTTPVLAKDSGRGGRRGWREPEKTVYTAQTLTAESEHYNVGVTFDESAKIEAGATVQVTEFAEGSPEFEAARAIVSARKGADADNFGFAAFDITLYNANGEVIEPQGASVNVAVSMKLPEEAAKAENLELYHLDETTGTAVAETVASDEEITVVDAEARAEFAVNGFSTFALTWENAAGEEESALVHWGYYDNGSFVELDAAKLDATATSISLANTFDGYVYVGSVYSAPNTSLAAGVDIDSVLTKAENGWQMTQYVTGEDESTTSQTAVAANNSNIYVIYAAKTSENTNPESPEDVDGPTTTKTVTDNGDGTYTIQLDIEGVVNQEVDSSGANVLLVLDTTYSMASSMTGATNRFEAARSAALTLIDTLDCGTNDIDLALVEFNSVGSVKYNWTKDYTTFRNYMQNTAAHASSATGTNWESGLYFARQVLESKDSDSTYVIFLTDGEPNRRGTTTSTNANAATAISYALTQAQAITGTANTYLYGVFCGSASGYNNLNGMINNAGGEGTINGTDAEGIKSAFEDIAHYIVNNLGSSDVSVDDGVPSLAAVSANVSGEAGGFEYYITPKDGEMTEWEDAPGASYSNDNGVTWDLSKVGSLPSGTVYTLKFTVWPSQAAYDLIADLNNGIRNYEDLSDAEKAGVTGSKETGYTMLTNTHLNTTYTYKGETYTDPADYEEMAMPLPTATIGIQKEWNNELDGREGSPVKLIVTKDGKEYLANEATTVSKDNSWTVNGIYISMGNITVHDGGATVKEPGHDYTIKEPADLEYYWELTADTYHPMVINGIATMLILDEEATTADNTNTFEINGKIYKKAEGDNVIKANNDRRSYLNVTKKIDGTVADIDKDALFEFTVKIDDPNGKHPGDEGYDAAKVDGYWFSIYDPENGTVKDSSYVTGATAEEGDTGYYYADNGASITIKLKANWNVRFINLRSGTTYEVTESETMDPGYVFGKAEATVKGSDKATAATISGMKASGTIDQPNTDYTVTYTNKYLGFFYVYHSADCEVERIPMTDSRVKKTYNADNDTYSYEFDIVNEVKAESDKHDYLYGGYYSDYAGKSEGYDSTKVTTWTDNKYKDASGKAYNYANIASVKWVYDDGYTVDGFKMNPVINTTYYLKEVPTGYLQPYTQYTYYKKGYLLADLFEITAIDDLCYERLGFMIVKDLKDAVGIYRTLTIKAEHMTTSTQLTPAKTFKAQGVQSGYMGYVKISDLIGTGADSITQFWDTKDNVRVFGIKQRKLNNGTKITNFKKTDSDYDNKPIDLN